MDMELIGGITAVPLIIALLEVIKKMFPVTKEYIPLIAICLGLIASYAYTFYGATNYYQSTVVGLAIGLSSVGLFSGVKNVKEALSK